TDTDCRTDPPFKLRGVIECVKGKNDINSAKSDTREELRKNLPAALKGGGVCASVASLNH
ncbi:hypothetical protein, partial [Pseudomonas sp. GW456-R21]